MVVNLVADPSTTPSSGCSSTTWKRRAQPASYSDELGSFSHRRWGPLHVPLFLASRAQLPTPATPVHPTSFPESSGCCNNSRLRPSSSLSLPQHPHPAHLTPPPLSMSSEMNSKTSETVSTDAWSRSDAPQHEKCACPAPVSQTDSGASNSSSNTAIASSSCQELDASLSDPSSSIRPLPYASNQPGVRLDRQHTLASSLLTLKTLRQRPPVPRIIIPDGESINISTPPSTPREEYISRLSSSPVFHTAVGTDATHSSPIMGGGLWYNSLKQIRNRLFPQGENPSVSSGQRRYHRNNLSHNAKERGLWLQSECDNRQHYGSNVFPLNDNELSSIPTLANHFLGTTQQTPPVHPFDLPLSPLPASLPTEASLAMGTTTGRIDKELPLLPSPSYPSSSHPERQWPRDYIHESGYLDFSPWRRQGSNAVHPSGAWAFSDDEDDEEFMSRTPGRLFSKERWRHLLFSRAGLKKTSKFATSTILGTIMIIALALTAVGQLKSRARATEPVPETLVGLIMDAQIVLVKDSSDLEVAFNSINTRTTVGASQTKSTQPIPQAPIADTEEKNREVRLKNAFNIPVWTGPIQMDCLHGTCGPRDLSQGYFAFLNPNAFGIALPNNWPALCNSCIEISRNQFVYKTTVRLLGDLEACLDNSKPNPPMTTNIQVNSFATQSSGNDPASMLMPSSTTTALASFSTTVQTFTSPTGSPVTTVMPASGSGAAVTSRERTRPILSKEPGQRIKVDNEPLLSAENSFALDGTNVISPMGLYPAEGSLAATTPSTIVPFTTFKSTTSFVSKIELPKESEVLNGVEKDHPLSWRRHRSGRRLVKRIEAAATEVLTSTPNEKDTTPIQQSSPTITSAFMTTTTPRPESTPNPAGFWSTRDLPLLMVDPLTFMNLTTFDSTTVLQKMDRLLVHFRFVECPN